MKAEIVTPELSDLSRLRLALVPESAARSDLAPRQVNYARQAAVALNLATGKGTNITPTPLGSRLLAAKAGSVEEKLVLREAVQSSDLVRLVVPDLLEHPTTSALTTTLTHAPRVGLAPDTARKRASALAGWSEQLATKTEPTAKPKQRERPVAPVSSPGKVLIVHLSDIHFQVDESKNHVLSKVDPMAAAIAARDNFENSELCLVLVSGDIAQSGQTQEYQHAHRFLTSLSAALRLRLAGTIHVATVPGNHDLDLSRPNLARDRLIESATNNPVDDSIAAICLSPQTNYEAFAASIQPNATKKTPLLHTLTLNTTRHTIELLLLNSAWDSQRHEPERVNTFETVDVCIL